MFFTIFKFSRVGSSALQESLNATPATVCVPEILNSASRWTSKQKVIDQRLKEAMSGQKPEHLGFTLNPFKEPVCRSVSFFDPSAWAAEHGGLAVFCLYREQIFDRVISHWLSMQMKVWPNHKESGGADRLIE
ncbi:MAG: hypothetical protein E1N59_1996 [Puniceicoccaceae bacterium 5H]|nr:MAG: hypothetical protein E1N59_1996 [Puniceicoccaceae bacterium 5H]